MLKAERRNNDCALETREGDTYVSNIGQQQKIPDIVQIPSGTNIIRQGSGDVSYVTFDLETGGLLRTSDILQISVVHGTNEFNRYVTPSQHISKGASDVTKLTVINGQLCFDGKPVDTVSVNEALHDFINFLKTISRPLLAGHNIKTFDLIFLYNNLVNCEYWECFQSITVGFVDTLAVFKKEFRKRKSYKWKVLMHDLMHETYSAHNALDDVKALQKLLELVKPTLAKHMFSHNIILNLVSAATYRLTLKPLEDSKSITKTMASKIAKSGLNY